MCGIVGLYLKKPELEAQLGKLFDRLRADPALRDNTLLLICSDNGPVMDDGYVDFALEKLGTHRAGGPFRGGKYSVFEGGTRTPGATEKARPSACPGPW